MPRPDEGVEPHVGRIQNCADRWDDSDMVAEHREIADAFGLGAHHCKRGGGSSSFKADGKKHHVLVGIKPRELQSVRRRIHDPNVHTTSLVLKRAPLSSGHTHHVAESGEDNVGLLGYRKTIVDSSHRKHADRAARAVNQLDVFRKDVFQAEAIDGMSMSATDIHHAVVAFRTGEATNFFCRLRNQFGFAELIDESHADPFLEG